MPEAVTNVEIEDVLSSIRRLISEDGRGDASARDDAGPASEPVKDAETSATERLVLTNTAAVDPAPTPEPDTQAEPERLVLTPALRVLSDEPAPQDVIDAAGKVIEAEALVEAENDAQAEPEQDHSDTAEQVDEPEMEAVEVTAPEHVEPEHVEPEHAESENAEPEHTESAHKDADNVLEAVAALTEAPTPEVEEAHEPADGAQNDADAVDTDTAQADDAQALDDATQPDETGRGDDATSLPEFTHVEVDTASIVDTEEQADTSVEEAVTNGEDAAFATRIAQLEKLMGGANDVDYEPEPHETDATAENDSVVTPIPLRRASPEPVDSKEDELGLSLDEDTLRDLVTEIVRQELQGALGERITRNVRKLVRREIHRALASQEID